MIVTASHPEFSTWLAQIRAADPMDVPFCTPVDIAWTQATWPDTAFDDQSFLVVMEGRPVMGLVMSVGSAPDGTRTLSGFGRPIHYTVTGDQSLLRSGAAAKAFGAHLRAVLDRYEGFPLFYVDYMRGGALSLAGDLFLEAGCVAVPRLDRVINLTHSEEDLRSGLRKSYGSLVSWGLKNLEIRIGEGAAYTPDDLERFRNLHIHVCGRETRSLASWQAQYGMISHGPDYVVEGWFRGEMVTAAHILAGCNYAYYGTSAARRDMFEKPLSHAILWTALLHAKRRGLSCFEMGEILYAGKDNPTSKELGISTFKRGFGGDAMARLKITWGTP
jgi:hypothetical protein